VSRDIFFQFLNFIFLYFGLLFRRKMTALFECPLAVTGEKITMMIQSNLTHRGWIFLCRTGLNFQQMSNVCGVIVVFGLKWKQWTVSSLLQGWPNFSAQGPNFNFIFLVWVSSSFLTYCCHV